MGICAVSCSCNSRSMAFNVTFGLSMELAGGVAKNSTRGGKFECAIFNDETAASRGKFDFVTRRKPRLNCLYRALCKLLDVYARRAHGKSQLLYGIEACNKSDATL